MTWDQLESPLLVSLLIVILAALGITVSRFLHRRLVRLIASLDRLREGRRKQLLTLLATLRWIVDVLILGSALLMVLSALGVNITPALASVGVAGLALSLGAQTLIKDIIGGIFILVENQYAVGDVIKVGAVSGVVERITLRSTYLRDSGGTLQMVPNGDVRVVANLTRDWSQAVVEVDLNYETDYDRARDAFETLASDFVHDPRVAPHLIGPPRMVGPVGLKSGTATLRIVAKTDPGRQWEVSRALQEHLLELCERRGIELQRVVRPLPDHSDLA